MPSESIEIRKLLRKLYVLRLTLYLSFVVALGTTTFVLAPAFFQFSGYGPLVPGPVAQTTFANTTATTLFTASSTSGGYGVLVPATPNPLNTFRPDGAHLMDCFWGGRHLAWPRALQL